MFRLILAATFLIAALATSAIALASDCPGFCRVERSRSVERRGVKREVRVERVRLLRR
jgi:hypothetical protein